VGEKSKHSNIKFWGEHLREKNKEQNKSDAGAHWRPEACELFQLSILRFKFSSTNNYVNAQPACL